jgi:phosphomannomutase/phosphoglucomutase
MVTASHNPAEYNGFKIILGNLPVTEEELARIRELAETGDFAAGKATIAQQNVLPDYETWLAESGKDLIRGMRRAPRVVIDCGNGCYSEIAPRVFERLSIPCVPLFCEPDGSFPNRSPNSAIADNLTALCEAVVRERADLGVAFDGDGDRVSFVDERGEFLPADQAIGIVARRLPNGLKPGDKVVLDQKCSAAVAELVSAMGATPLMEKSGHTFIKTRMITENARFGGEISGHLFYRELAGGDDGLYSAILMTGIIGRHGPLSKLASELPAYATTPEMRIRVEPDPAVLDAIAKAFPPERVSRLDGVRVQFDDGWALARLSVTEPVVTLRFEGRDKKALRRIMQEFLSPVPELRDRIESQNSKVESPNITTEE